MWPSGCSQAGSPASAVKTGTPGGALLVGATGDSPGSGVATGRVSEDVPPAEGEAVSCGLVAVAAACPATGVGLATGVDAHAAIIRLAAQANPKMTNLLFK